MSVVASTGSYSIFNSGGGIGVVGSVGNWLAISFSWSRSLVRLGEAASWALEPLSEEVEDVDDDTEEGEGVFSDLILDISGLMSVSRHLCGSSGVFLLLFCCLVLISIRSLISWVSASFE